jgi:hypothetical protein
LDYKVILGVYASTITDEQVKIADTAIQKFGDKYFLLSSYIVKESPLKGEYGNDTALTNDEVAIINSFHWRTYFIGYIRYQNIITGKMRIYKFTIELECKTGGGATFWYGDNRNITAEEAKKPIHIEYWK